MAWGREEGEVREAVIVAGSYVVDLGSSTVASFSVVSCCAQSSVASLHSAYAYGPITREP
jgi:hypothetical protein